MNNKEIAHLWANQSRPRGTGSHFYFEGDTIFSYGSHFPIARHYKGAVLFTRRDHSVTTSQHKSIARRAASHLPIFVVVNPLEKPGRADVAAYAEDIKSRTLAAGRARNPDFHLAELERQIANANAFCEKFGFTTRFEMPGNIEELRAKAKASAEREAKARERAKAKLEAENANTIAMWLAGEGVTIPHAITRVYLRASNGNLETSKGARVVLDEAHKAYRFCRLHRANGWHRNGETFRIGDYNLDAVNEAGIVAGCHRIEWNEVERFATAQGWA